MSTELAAATVLLLLLLLETIVVYGEPACLVKDEVLFKPAAAAGCQLHQDSISWNATFFR